MQTLLINGSQLAEFAASVMTVNVIVVSFAFVTFKKRALGSAPKSVPTTLCDVGVLNANALVIPISTAISIMAFLILFIRLNLKFYSVNYLNRLADLSVSCARNILI
jgi:hypothetical protein